jgi:uncharacterized protein YecE (DUF72 family)
MVSHKSDRVTRIRIGTASWTDPGFVEDWYPPKLAPKDRLRWYAEHFDYVEVNSTFYAIPAMRMVDRWCLETPADFLFDLKLPKLLSRHAMPAKFLPPDLRSRVSVRGANVELTSDSERLVCERFLREIKPLFAARKFGAFLLQLSPGFRPKSNELTELDSVHQRLAPHSFAVELRNRGWVTGSQLSETIDYFKSRGITFVLVDAPQSEHFTVMPGMNCVTNPKLGYFRFHGRNESGYIRGRTVAERFDHDYSEEEVEELTERIREVEKEIEELHLVANNNRSNYAPRLAERLQRALRQKARLTEPKQQDLFSLG